MRIRHMGMLVLGMATLAVGPQAATAQEEADEVLATVQRFFDSMTARDTAEARRVLVLDATYFRVRDDPTGTDVRRSTNRQYVDGLAGGSDLLEERMWDPEVKIHGSIAMVWTPYDFHVNGQFSHCGVDAFTLVKTDEGWKIAGVVYTVERDCADRPA